MILLNKMEHPNSAPSPSGFGNPNAPIRMEHLEAFLKLLAPFAPHISEELWQQTRGLTQTERGQTQTKFPRKSASSQRQFAFKSIHLEKWPEYDEKLLKTETFTLVIQVNGKTRDIIEAPTGISREEAEKLALRREKIQNIIKSSTAKKIIYVPDRLINIVV